jgi:nucleotide-binding universal stress UspA family protein
MSEFNRSDPPLIICATRGGEGSRAAQQAAVNHAREIGARLEFVFVVDEMQIAGIDNVLRPALRKELLWIGRALVELAARRGRLAGVPAEIVVLEGVLREQLIAYLREHHVDTMYVGAPRGTTANIFGDEEVEQFALLLERESGSNVVVVRPDQP